MLLEVAPPAEATRFLCETSVTCTVEAVLAKVVRLHNLRSQLAARSGASADSQPLTGKKRTSEEAFTLATTLLSPTSVRQKLIFTQDLLNDAIAKCGAPDDSAEQSATPDLLESDAGLFFAGRWLEIEKPLSDYVGRNEKSKVTVSLCTTGVPPNARGSALAVAPSGGTDNAAASSDAVAASEAHVASAAASASAAGAVTSASAAAASLLASHSQAGRSLSAYFRNKGGSGTEAPVEAGESGGEEEEEDETRLSASQVERLCSSSLVFAALGNQRLQTLVREIDGAASREAALRKLERALVDPDFEQFTRTVLEQAGIVG